MKKETPTIHQPKGADDPQGWPGSSEPSPELVRAQLVRILASPGFARAERLSKLLRYIVEKTLEGQGSHIKEYLLGVEVFDRIPSYDPRIDPIVRVEAARLRAKLREFYQTEGRQDPVRIDLEKGHYLPQFHHAQKAETRDVLPAIRLWRTLDWKTAVLLAGWLAAAVLAAWMLRITQNRAAPDFSETAHAPVIESEYLPLWGNYFANQATNYVVFGSPMFFSSDSLKLFLRKTTVNNPASFLADPDFKALVERFGPLAGPWYDYAEMGDAIALQRLTAFFGKAGAALTALPAHQATWDTIKDNNTIFLGTPRMNPLLRNLPVQKDFEWGTDDYIHNRNPQPGELKSYPTSSNRNSVSYAVIASFPGLHPGRQILLLMSHSSPGALAAVDYVTRLDSMRDLAWRVKSDGQGKMKHFQMLLRILVDNNVPVKIEYVTHHEVPASQ